VEPRPPICKNGSRAPGPRARSRGRTTRASEPGWDDPPGRRGLWGCRRRYRAHPPARLTTIRSEGSLGAAQPTSCYVLYERIGDVVGTEQMLALRVGDRDSRADRPASLPTRQPASSPSSRRLGMRGRQSPGAGRCITAPGKVQWVASVLRDNPGTAWSGGADDR
jgi:hypothetical protein